MERNKKHRIFYRFAFCLPVILHISVSTTLYDERFTLGGDRLSSLYYRIPSW